MACRCYEKALELDNSNDEIYYNFGNALYECGNYSLALKQYSAACERNSEDYNSRNNIADCLIHLERFEEALIEIDQVLTVKADYLPAFLTRGELYLSIGKNDLAKNEFNEVINLGKSAIGKDGKINAMVRYAQDMSNSI
jgi:tetratricopeptide (TPR) repeat protein